MKMRKDECLECGGNSTLREPDGIIECLECGCHTETPRSTRRRSTPAPVITVSRYRKTDGYATRYYAIYLNGSLLAVTLYRKGAETVRTMLLEMHDAKGMSTALPIYDGEPCLLPPAQREDVIRACVGSVSIDLARENGFCADQDEPRCDQPPHAPQCTPLPGNIANKD